MKKPLDQPLEPTIPTNNRTLVGIVLFFLAVVFCCFNGTFLLFYQSQSPYFGGDVLIITGILYLPLVLLASYLVYLFAAFVLLCLEVLGWLLHLKKFQNWIRQQHHKYTFFLAFVTVQLLMTVGFIYQLLVG